MDSPHLEIPQSIADGLLSSTVCMAIPSDIINFAELWTISKCDGRMCQIRELGVTFALNLQNTGVYGGGRGRRMGRMDASEKSHSLRKVFLRYIDHYYKLCLFLKNRLEEIIEK